MGTGHVFLGFEEADVCFRPSFKYDKGATRVPADLDRGEPGPCPPPVPLAGIIATRSRLLLPS